MSSNNTGEPDEITGQSALPSTYEIPKGRESTNRFLVSRIKKIIQLDEDIVQCSNNSTFVIAMATVRHPSDDPTCLVYSY